MRVVTNQQRVKRNRQIAQILYFTSLAVFISGLLVINTLARDNEVFLYLPCLITPLGLIAMVVSLRLSNQYMRPPHPEDAIREGLKGINRRSVLYNYVLPANHVLVSPQGVYTFATRFQESRFKVEGDKWYNWKNRGPLAPLFLFLKQEGLGDPFKQANAEADAVQAIVDQTLPGTKIEVQPVVVFSNPKATLEVIDPDIPVVYADPKKKPSLKGLLREDKRRDDSATLSPAEIESIDEAFMASLGERKRKNQLVEEV
jgi:Nuclease-related domain